MMYSSCSFQQQPRRILISRLRDLTVRFLDLSPQLLVSTGPDAPLGTSFPSPIPRLTIDVAPLLIDRSLGLSGGDSASYDPRLSTERIDGVHFAHESLECAVVLRSQAVILYRLDVPADTQPFGQQTLQDKELVSLAHIRTRVGRRYSPVLAVKPDSARGLVSSCALSDIGMWCIPLPGLASLQPILQGSLRWPMLQGCYW